MRVAAAFLVALAVPLFAQSVLIDQGRAALLSGHDDAAVHLLEQAASLAPQTSNAHYWLGTAYASQAQKAGLFAAIALAGKAKEQFQRAVALDPGNTEARFGLVEFYAVAPRIIGGDLGKALRQAAEIRKRDPYMAHRACALVYARQKRGDLARKEYLDAVAEQPGFAPAHASLGAYVLNTDKNYPWAFDELEAAIQLNPAYMPAWYHLGRAAAMSGTRLARGEEALARYLRSTPQITDPALANAHYWLGIIYEKEGRKADARESFARALTLWPDSRQFAEALQRVR